MAEFKERLKGLRNDARLTQGELAKKVGITTSAISMYEQGNRKPSIEALEVLADYFKVDIDYLLGRSSRRTYYLDSETDRLAQELKKKTISMPLGDIIRLRREESGLSQDELARKLGYKSRSTIAKLESGVNDLITQSKIKAFAGALNTTVADLLGLENSIQEPCHAGPKINKEIGKRISKSREDIGITRKELAEKIGVAASTITRYEKGNIEKIKIPVIEAISRVLGVNPNWIIGKSECKRTEEIHTEELSEQLRTNASLRMIFKALTELEQDKVKEVYNYVQYLKFKDSK